MLRISKLGEREGKMNSERKIIDCFCGWYDLLGYGTAFKEAGWDLHNEVCLKNYKRIKKIGTEFHNSYTQGKTLIINDGVIKTFDVNGEKGDINNIINFLIQYVDGFNKINEIDKKGNYPGVRGVFTFGQRYEYIPGNFIYNQSDGEIVTYYPEEFQMNTAFSKANIIEESGSKKGIAGPFLFFDKYALDEIRKIANRTKGYDVIEQYKDEKYYFSINILKHSAITLIFDENIIEYQNKDRKIETQILKLIDSKY